jgi:hypothetical protein
MNPQNDYANDFGLNPNALNNRESSDWNQNKIKIQPNIPNQAAVIPPPQPDVNKKKKNRTLQFYKFLFYSIKIEIKINEFVDLVRFANQSEISLWILSLVLYSHSPKEYSNVFIWIHLIHVIRGLIGFLIMLKLPRSYEIVEAMRNVPEKDLEKKLFNDIARNVVKTQVVDKLQTMKNPLIFYFFLTFVNFLFDLIDFCYTLTHFFEVYFPRCLFSSII